MTHSQRKSSVKLKSHDHFREVILSNFPELQHKIFIIDHVTVGDIKYLMNLCNFDGDPRSSGAIIKLEPLTNYMIDNKHMYEWWQL